MKYHIQRSRRVLKMHYNERMLNLVLHFMVIEIGKILLHQKRDSNTIVVVYGYYSL